MRNMKRWLAVLLAVVMVLPSLLVPGFAAGSGFEDVPENSWYASAVEYVNEKGYMTGVGENKFAPDVDVTRAMFVTVLSRLAMVQTDGLTSDFADVAAGRWYTGAIAWAAEKGIVNGVGGGRFAPTKAITRQDLCTILYRFVNVMGYELTATRDVNFTDAASVSAYASDAVRFAASVGLVAGYDDGAFHPKDTATRAQTAVIVMRLAQLLDGQIVKPEPMPAQSFAKEAGNGMAVTVEAPEGALPENTDMTVSRVTDEAALADLHSKLDADILGAVDISFAKDGAEIEPARKVSVRIALDGIQNAEHPAVVHIRDDGSFEYVASNVITTRGKTAEIEFEADSFSVYVVTDGGTGTFFNVTVEFYSRANGSTGAWEITNKQIIRNDQLGSGKTPVTDPGVPSITPTQSFEGWFKSATAPSSFGEDDEGVSVEEINADVNSQTGKITLKYYAMVFDVVFITYHDQAGNVIETQSEHITGASGSQRTLKKVFEKNYIPFKGDQKFFGWTPASNIKLDANNEMILGDYPEYVSEDSSTYYVVDNVTEYDIVYAADVNNLHVYPYLSRGYWLIFDTNIASNNSENEFDDPTSASYTGPMLVRAGQLPTAPDTPTRTGYSFGSDSSVAAKDTEWYADPSMTRLFDFNKPLTGDTTVYAKWTPAETEYWIVIWKQKSTDGVDAVDTLPDPNTGNLKAKTYDYFTSRKVQGATTGNVVGISADGVDDTTWNVAQNNENNFYFQYNSSKSDKTVAGGSTVKAKGDGTTVLNVYYDRKTITYNFGPNEPTPSYSPISNPTWNYDTINYYKSGTSYYQCFGYLSSGTQYYYKEVTGDLSTNTTYYIRVYDGIYQYKYNSTYSGYVWYDDTRQGYYYWSGTVFTRSTSAPSPVYRITNMTLPSVTYSHQGLYGAQYSASDWPSAGSGNTWSCYDYSDGTVYQYPLALTEYVPTWQNQSDPTDAYLTMNFYVSEYTTSTIPVKYVGASLSNASLYDVNLATGTARKGGNWYPTETIQGFTIKGYAFRSSAPTSSTSWTSCTTTSQIEVGSSETKTLYIAFTRNNYTLTFSSTTAAGTATSDKTVPFKSPMSGYDDETPTNTWEGYYFDGWYTDEACSEGNEYKFSTETMPASNLVLYAKWSPLRFRVVLDYNAGTDTITFPGNQADSFRLNYGEQVEESAIQAAERKGYVLLGWYFRENGTGEEKEFNFAMGAHEDMADMTYGQRKTDPTTGEYTETEEEFMARMNSSERTGQYKVVPNATGDTTWDDKWTAENPTRKNVIGKIVIYAKWRENPDGLTGVNVKYYADHSETDQGYFDVNENPKPDVWDDPYIYVNNADAYAQPASVPENLRECFLYWELLDANGDVVKTVYPGKTFSVDTQYAVKTHTLKDQYKTECEHENATPVAATSEPTCTEGAHAAYWYCPDCGKYFEDNNGERGEETTLEALTTQAALGHNWGAWTQTTAPTCTEAGVETRECGRCHITETRPVAALNHNWGTPTYTWDPSALPVNGTVTCTGTAACTRAGCSETVTETVTAQWHVDTDPTTSSTGTGHYTATFTNNPFTEQTSATVTIPVLTGYTVTYSVPTGLTGPEPEFVEPNENASLPATWTGKADPEGYTFLGWVAETHDNSTTEVTPLESYTVTGDVTLHALYSHTDNSGKAYELLTAAPADWAGNYVITYGINSSMYVMTGVSGSSSGTSIEDTSNTTTFVNTGISLNDSVLTNVADSYLFTLAASGSYYSIQSVSTGSYLGQLNDTYHTLAAYSTFNTDYCRWTPGVGTNCSSFSNPSSTKYPYLSFRDGSGYYYFWTGSSSNTAYPSVRLWKETSSSTTTWTTEINMVTVTYMANGSQYDQAAVPQGGSVTLPDTATAVTGYTFAGWVANQITTGTTTQPTILTGSYTPSGNVTLYALYTYEQGNGTDIYQLADGLQNGGKYIIVANSSVSGTTGYAVGNTVVSSYGYYLTPVAVTINNDDTCTTSSAATVLWVASGDATNGYTLNNEAVGKYMGINTTEYLAVVETGKAWFYTAEGYLDDLGDSEDYRYLSYGSKSGTYVYTTSKAPSSTSDLTVRLYHAVEDTDTYYVTSIPDGGEAVTEPVEQQNAEPEQTEPTRGLNNNPNPVTVSNTVWVPTDTIETGKEYLIGVVYNGNTYLALNYNPAQSSNHYFAEHNFEYTISGTTYTSSTASYIGYTGTAVFNGSNVSGMTGDTTDLQYATWKFVSATNGYYIQSAYESSRYLQAAIGSSSYYWDEYPGTSGSVWTWDADSHALKVYRSSVYTAAYAVDNVFYLSPDSETGDHTHVQLYVKQTDHTLTVTYTHPEDSSVTWPDTHTEQVVEGAQYSYTVPTVVGYTPNVSVVTGTMGTEDITVNVTYRKTVVSVERWEEVTTIDDTTKDYLIGVQIDGQIYLLINNSTYTDDAIKYTKVGLAAFDGTILTSVSGATTDLGDCRWNFSTSSGGTITSAKDGSKGLYFTANGGLYPDSNPDTWVWGGSANTMTATVTNTWYMYGKFVNGTPVAGVQRGSSATVRIYREVEDENTTYDVSFEDEEGKPIEGLDTQTVNNGDKIAEPAAPEKVDYYFLGWFKKGESEPFDFANTGITADTVLVARYDYMYIDTYTVQLRAVYGVPNITGNTHIYWYANDGTTKTLEVEVDGETKQVSLGEGAGDRFEMNEIAMNTPQNIPTPTTWTGVAEGGSLTGREDRVFLGWARVNNEGSGETGKYQELSEADLYLKWIADSTKPNGGYYKYKNDQGEWTNCPVPSTGSVKVGQVYADETQPYHDMYAVWASYAYVFHSATGKLEAIEVKSTKGVVKPVDLTDMVTTNKLYGGYYKAYGGTDGIPMRTFQNTAMTNAYTVDYANGAADKLVTVTGAATYDGSLIRPAGGNVRFWAKANAYDISKSTEENPVYAGNELVPTVGTIYYLKEVPNSYLPARLIAIRNTGENDGDYDHPGDISDLFLLTAVDDTNYKSSGYQYSTTGTPSGDPSRTSFSNAFVTVYKVMDDNGNYHYESVSYDAHKLNDAITRGYVAARRVAVQSAYATPAWTTLDGVVVNQHPVYMEVTTDTVTWSPQ